MSGTCEDCGRRWGGDAPEGVHADSPCPVGGLRGHDWMSFAEPAEEEGLLKPLFLCRHCNQRQLQEPEEEEAQIVEMPLLDVIQVSFTYLCKQYNQMGEQLKALAELLGQLVDGQVKDGEHEKN